MLKILAIGATSTIAQETLRHFAKDGATLFLVGRNTAKLEAVADDLRIRGAQLATPHTLDMTDHAQQPTMWREALETLNGVDVLFIAHGTLGDPAAASADYAVALRELDNNFLSVVPVLTLAANYMEQQGRGVIAVISSVAGDRGRASNYVYGTGMAAKTAFLSGLRNRLAGAGVQVLTIKPGRVNTPMTQHMAGSEGFADPIDIGQQIYKAMKRRRDVVYLPFIWRYIMSIIRLIPEPIFKRLKL